MRKRKNNFSLNIYDGRKTRVFLCKTNMAGVSKMIERSNVELCVLIDLVFRIHRSFLGTGVYLSSTAAKSVLVHSLRGLKPLCQDILHRDLSASGPWAQIFFATLLPPLYFIIHFFHIYHHIFKVNIFVHVMIISHLHRHFHHHHHLHVYLRHPDDVKILLHLGIK